MPVVAVQLTQMQVVMVAVAEVVATPLAQHLAAQEL
jgi:hypothetical protein